MVNYLTDFRIPLFFLLPYVLFFGGLLMLKAASKLRNFSFSLRFVFCLPPQAPLVLLIFVVQTLFENWATLRMFFSLINARRGDQHAGPPREYGDSVHGTFKPKRGRISKDG